jgi:hypothetical protein
MTNYFIYCEYSGNFCPRAIFIPLNNLDNNMKNAYNKIIELGNKIEDCYESKDNCGYHIGYKIKDNFDNSEDTKKTIGFWSSWLSQLDHDHEGLLPEEYLMYYINDKNSKYSPNELFDKLSSLSEFRGIKMNIENCVMVSEVPFNKVTKVTLRFNLFTKNDYTPEEVTNILLKDDKFNKVQCAEKDGKFCGYGFVQLKNNDDYDILFKQEYIIDNNTFFFD